MFAAGTPAIMIGWGASRVRLVKGEVKRNREDKLQVLPMTGFVKMFLSENFIMPHESKRDPFGTEFINVPILQCQFQVCPS